MDDGTEQGGKQGYGKATTDPLRGWQPEKQQQAPFESTEADSWRRRWSAGGSFADGDCGMGAVKHIVARYVVARYIVLGYIGDRGPGIDADDTTAGQDCGCSSCDL